MTDPILAVVKEWTGDEPIGCPWFAFRDPFVARVLRAFRFFDKGQLSAIEPHPSRKLLEGLEYYAYVSTRIARKRDEKAAEDREREAARARAAARGHTVSRMVS